MLQRATIQVPASRSSRLRRGLSKPIKNLANQAAEVAVKLATGRPIIARDELDNGKVRVPSIFLDIVAVTKENMEDTVIKDGFLKKEEVFQSAEAKP